MAFGDFAIAPSTTVTLCAGVPLAKGSEDTILFGSAGEQAATIGSYSIGTFSNITYQRNTRDVIRVEIPAMRESGASVLRANYCIFNNSAFEGKNIYCFVDTVDYVNNNTADIHITIDAMQTFMFDYTLKQCYVEREHSVTDRVGDNLIPEDFGTLPTVIAEVSNDLLFKAQGGELKYQCCIYYIENSGVDTDGTIDMTTYRVEGAVKNNVYTGCNVKNEDAVSTDIDYRINTIIHNGGTIVGIQMIPLSVIRADSNGGVIKSVSFLKPSVIIDNNDPNYSYAPKNKKLMTYPYCYLTASNNLGEERQYRWEWFDNLSEASFKWYGAYIPTPDTAIVPLNYKGQAECYGEKVSFNTFPTCTWSEDSFMQWWLRNGNAYNTSVFSNLVSGFTSAAGGAAVGAAVGSKAGLPGIIGGAVIGAGTSLIGTLTNNSKIEAGYKDQQAAPDKLSGSPSSAIVNEVIGNTGFTLYAMNIPLQLAKSIDDYFTMFGYATKRVKTPNINSRPVYNYVKTQGCTIYGRVPAPYALEIQERFNNGVRFWKTTDVGNYGLDNTVL